MSPKREDIVAPSAVDGEYELRFASSDAVKGWEELARQAPRNVRRAFEAIRDRTRTTAESERHHRLKGELGTGTLRGEEFERWQYEVTGAGRLWYLLDEDKRTVWITDATTGHPKFTE